MLPELPPPAGWPSISQCVLMLLGLVSTGFLGTITFIFSRGLKRIDAMEENMTESTKAQSQVLNVLSANQEQIKTLFRQQDEQRDDIKEVESRLNRREENDRYLPPPSTPHRRRH